MTYIGHKPDRFSELLMTTTVLVMIMENELKKLPSIDEVLRTASLAGQGAVISRQQVLECTRQAVAEYRQRIIDGELFSKQLVLQKIVTRTNQLLSCIDGCHQQQVINATGVLLHTNLGRAPLAELAVQRMAESASYVNVEMNLTTGQRNYRGEHARKLLCQLTGADDAAVVNNCAAATILVLQALAAGREVIVSRGQLVEIGGGYRLPEVFSASGALLKEVGTTNRTYVHDYERAMTEKTAAVMRVHRSNFSQAGFVAEPGLDELVALGRRRNIRVIDDLGSGCIHDLSRFGLSEPTVLGSVAAGADMVLFSGDKLFGGPQAGIIVGRHEWVSALHQSPMMRAFRVDKLTLAALGATAEIHLSGNALQDLPLLRMLTRDANDVRSLCEAVHQQLTVPEGISVSVETCISEVGGGSMPGAQVRSFGLRIKGMDAELLTKRLRCCIPAVLGRIQADAVFLDLRTVGDLQRKDLVKNLSIAIVQSNDEVGD